jgi:hypothetical protein
MADSSTMTSSDILKEIEEQTSQLVEGGVQEEVQEEVLAPVEEESQETATEETQETSEQTQAIEETQETLATEEQTETPLRIKYKGKEIDVPAEIIREYVQKGYRVEEKLRELKEKEAELTSKGQVGEVDFSKIDEDFVAELQKSPVRTLMQFTKTILETTEKERLQQRKFDRTFEREISASLPHWEAIKDGYHEYKDEGYDHKTSVAMAERDFFANLYLESKQKGIDEGVKKQTLKQKAQIPSGNKKGSTPTEMPSMKDIKNMTSDQMAQALGLKFTKNAGW